MFKKKKMGDLGLPNDIYKDLNNNTIELALN